MSALPPLTPYGLGLPPLAPVGLSGGAAPAAGGGQILEDASSPAPVHTAGGLTATTASFTPVANSTLVAIAECGNNTGSGVMTCPVTDSLGSTWLLLKREPPRSPGR
jgi:hypothetical protein